MRFELHDARSYELREHDDTWAVAREGTPGSPFWVVCRYDWSDPHRGPVDGGRDQLGRGRWRWRRSHPSCRRGRQSAPG